ncbi:DUF502 domain-containing protein [Chitinimonas taiwanensis]|uniref:Uncharacterized membrane protein n=1 Tax=Chitinimonas taiwanensis DSM 18899 TaxID=1121279 RepID=A0A1K2HQZ6_9NEIS|nr:DUF502 domain-containing protein [Chitinimonas taiwanensis]SFZ79191.1 Uncharacterized membrane protein [Chitinimonas taiwanensis DSM 18899]
MPSQPFRRLSATWLAGLLALLPLVLTVGLLVWTGQLLYHYLGPGSVVGSLLSWLGQPFARQPYLEYGLGILLLLLLIYPLGVLVQSSLRRHIDALIDLTLRRIPLIGSLYNLADRFVGLLDQKDGADITAMSPVWCLFSGDGAAVLALLPNPEPVHIDGRPYLAILVPTAPVPIGGGLLYVPSEWVRPAQIGVDKLSSIYVSMGIDAPPDLQAAVKQAQTSRATSAL